MTDADEALRAAGIAVARATADQCAPVLERQAASLAPLVRSGALPRWRLDRELGGIARASGLSRHGVQAAIEAGLAKRATFPESAGPSSDSEAPDTFGKTPGFLNEPPTLSRSVEEPPGDTIQGGATPLASWGGRRRNAGRPRSSNPTPRALKARAQRAAKRTTEGSGGDHAA